MCLGNLQRDGGEGPVGGCTILAGGVNSFRDLNGVSSFRDLFPLVLDKLVGTFTFRVLNSFCDSERDEGLHRAFCLSDGVLYDALNMIKDRTSKTIKSNTVLLPL